MNNAKVEPTNDGQEIDHVMETRVEPANYGQDIDHVMEDTISSSSELRYTNDGVNEGTLETTSNVDEIEDIGEVDEDQVNGSVRSHIGRQSLKSDVWSAASHRGGTSDPTNVPITDVGLLTDMPTDRQQTDILREPSVELTVDEQSLGQSPQRAETSNRSSGNAENDTDKVTFYTLPYGEHQPSFEHLLQVADRIHRYENDNYKNDDDNQQVDEIFPIMEISVTSGVCKVRETVGRDTRVNVFSGDDNSQMTTMPHTELSHNDDDQVIFVDEATEVNSFQHSCVDDDVNSFQHSCVDDNASRVVSNCTSDVSQLAFDDLSQVDETGNNVVDDLSALTTEIDPSNDNGLDEGESERFDQCSPAIELYESSGSYKSSASHVYRQQTRGTDNCGILNGGVAEEERVMTLLLWKLAIKQLKPDDWKKLAKYWKFTTDHINAIQQQYTGN